MRAKFMIETINNLKNNRMKTSIATSTIASEHTIRMKKTLGTLNTRTVRASEPLRIGLKDLRESNKRGKWWLVGASYKDESPDQRAETKQNKKSTSISQDPGFIDSTSTDLVQLAREQRMNTDVRRSIFIAIMSATDYKDAYLRLQKLRLKKAQELEIPKVIIHCAGAEEVYNPFYSLIARRVCSERKLKMAFQFSLWDLFRRMGEGKNDGSDGSDDSDDSDGDALSLRSLVNLAKLFGVLIAEGGLKISVLKVGLTYLRYSFIWALIAEHFIDTQLCLLAAKNSNFRRASTHHSHPSFSTGQGYEERREVYHGAFLVVKEYSEPGQRLAVFSEEGRQQDRRCW